MKERYRNMMEQITLSEDSRSVIEQELSKNSRTRKFGPLRMGLVAACVCIVLMGGVFAAGQLAKVRVGNTQSDPAHSEYDKRT